MTQLNNIPTPNTVDLGLPSGILWADSNIGAKNPWEPGMAFAWGETMCKPQYEWTTYKYSARAYNKLTKYCCLNTFNENVGNNGYTDTLTKLEPDDEAAITLLGNGWRMPTKAELYEIINNCDWQWVTRYNGKSVNGYVVKSKTKEGAQIFLPAADKPVLGIITGTYWSNQLNTNFPHCADALFFSDDVHHIIRDDRYKGVSIRAVKG